MICSGCGWIVLAGSRPFRCPNAGVATDVDHVLVRQIEARLDAFLDDEPDPFVRYRRMTFAWHDAMARGVSDGDFVDIVHRLEERIEAVDGRSFAVTPFDSRDGLWIKDETRNVAGSHKSRHLMGVLIWLETMSRFDRDLADAPLAIASCGNAALAAAVLARSARRRLDVFVPSETAAEVVDRIEALGAEVTRCARLEGAGDPAVTRFRAAVAAGALPFTCQGPENGLVIEGGSTLGWEMVSQLLACRGNIERVFIQTGGGALSSAVIAALGDGVACGALPHLPRIHAVQTTACSPLARAWERLPGRGIDYAIAHRSEFMWPWESVPASAAGGILDDETYDWAAVARGMLDSGGHPVLVSEEQLIAANRLAGGGVSVTGSAGLAGVLALPGEESTAVLFTGAGA